MDGRAGRYEHVCERRGAQAHHRSRKNVYAVQDESGGYKVIGSSCLQNYTGIQPEGLWVLTWDDLDDLQEEDSLRDGGGGWARGDVAAETPDVLRIAAGAAAVQGGFQNRYSDRPTGGLVSEVLFPSAYTREEDRALHAAVMDAAADVDPAELKAEILEALDGQDGDWPSNIRLLLEEQHVSSRHVTLLASAISAVERMRAKKREKATIASGFIAPVGEKVENIPARVLMLRESTSYYGGREKTSTLVKMQTESGHIVTWWASNPPKLDEGDDVVIDRATVKKHETYNDQDQTAVTRAKLTLAPAAQ